MDEVNETVINKGDDLENNDAKIKQIQISQKKEGIVNNDKRNFNIGMRIIR